MTRVLISLEGFFVDRIILISVGGCTRRDEKKIMASTLAIRYEHQSLTLDLCPMVNVLPYSGGLHTVMLEWLWLKKLVIVPDLSRVSIGGGVHRSDEESPI